jgi:spore coat protein CotH
MPVEHVIMWCTRLAFSTLLFSTICLPTFAQTASDLFNRGVLHDIRLSIHPTDWQNLRIHFDENTHYAADLHWTFEGHDIEIQQVSVRSRGGGSRSGVKPGLRVDFARFTDQTFLGLKGIVLRNNTQDGSMLRERLTMTFMSLIGIPAPRETHARVYINDAYAGLYTIVEAIDEPFLRRAFGESHGYLYEYNWGFAWFFQYLGADARNYSPIPFKPETHEMDPAPWPLEWMVRAINQIADPWFQVELSRYIDLSEFMRYIAVENFLAEQDGLLGDWGVNNFYLYRLENSDKFKLIAWDKSQTFTSLDWPIFRNIHTNVLARKAFAIPELRNVYMETLRQSAELAGGRGGWLEQEILNEYEQIHQAALEDPFKQCFESSRQFLTNCSNEQFESEVQFLVNFAQNRTQDVLRQLNPDISLTFE